jgi:hypothetical protein
MLNAQRLGTHLDTWLSNVFVRPGGAAALTLLALMQTAHLAEHVAQMVQIHVLGLSGPAARGIVGQLDLEWVHVIWNGAVLGLLVVLLTRFPRNRWLALAAVIATWHLVERVAIMAVYLSTGVVGTPGILARGGVAGGLPLRRPDLRFVTLAETTPLLLGWAHQVRAAHEFELAQEGAASKQGEALSRSGRPISARMANFSRPGSRTGQAFSAGEAQLE